MRFNLFSGRLTEMIQFELIPDRTIDNKKVHDLFRAISSFYASPFDIVTKKKLQGAFWWDVMLRGDEIRFFCAIPVEWKREIRLHLESTWPLSAIEEVEVRMTDIPESSSVSEMKYRRSNMFALQVDRRLELEPMKSILSITSEMHAGDIARLSICAEPMSRLDWQEWAERMHKEFRNGKTPRRSRLTKKYLFVSFGEMLTDVLHSLMGTLNTVLGYEEEKKAKDDDHEKRLLMIDGGLTRGTLNKLRMPTFHTLIRIASFSPDPQRQLFLNRSIGNSFNDVTADNELERHEIHDRLRPGIIQELNAHRIGLWSRLDWDKNKMSNEELGRLVELPTAALQDLHKDRISTLDTRQLEVPTALLNGGMKIGSVAFKKVAHDVFFPIGDHDQLCLPTVVIGGMGSGKTKGFACNRAVSFVKMGNSSLVIDPKNSEVWDIIKDILPKHQRRRILLGQDIISLDFREALQAPGGRARLTQIMLSFFDDNTDTTGSQTQRFLRAAVMGMQTGRISEIMKILTDEKYREQVIRKMPEGMNKSSLAEFTSYKPDRQRQIAAPIFNRLDVILGDPYLESCMNAEDGLDFVKITSELEVCTVIDVPDRLNTRLAKDILINLISFKIDAAMSQRQNVFPYAIIYDEPHQYLRSTELWKNVSVESRAYRFAYHWLFHSWEQIPRDLAQIIKDAGPHYYIHQSSKQTYKGLAEEIAPFTLDDGMNTKRWHAICALKVGNDRMTPFMCKMAAPPK